MLKKILVVSVCTAALTVSTVQAEDDGNWYAGLEAGYSLLGSENANGSASGLDIRNEFEDGAAIGGILGYDYGMLRLEGEIGFHRHSLDNLVVTNAGGTGVTNAATGGSSGLTTLMANVVVDLFDRKDGKPVEPFIGAGLGLGRLDWSGLAYVDNRKTTFAYQAFAGLRIPASDDLDVVAKYRYLATDDVGLTSSAGNNFQVSYDAHDFIVGLYYRFGGKTKTAADEMPQPIQVVQSEPEPAPIVEPEPEPEITAPEPIPEPAAGPIFDKGPFIVYFAFDSSELDGAGRTKVAEAAAEAKKAGEVVVMVDAYTDKAGADSYNDKLSARRAEAVKKALEAEGLPADMIVMASHGECDCEVETADGVREPRNRRATIVLK